MRSFHLAWRHVSFNRMKSLILILCLTLTAILPTTTSLLLDRYESEWRNRAQSTPLVIGARGSRFDLLFHVLYFRPMDSGTLTMQDSLSIQNSGHANAIPLHVRYTARDFPLTGTSLDYFEFRGLKTADGTLFVMLGDCVIGSEVARKLTLKPGDRLMSDPINAFDIAGSYPLNMRVAGVLKPNHSPDDHAVFIDVKTAWVIDGYAHGHENLVETRNKAAILNEQEGNIVANAALMQYTEITPENIATFHLHAQPDELPLTAIIAIPRDKKSETLLRGRYVSTSTAAQAIIPAQVLDELMEMILRIKRFFDVCFLFVAVASGLYMLLVVTLSTRLRKREFQTMFFLGCGRLTIFSLILWELLIVLVISVLLTSMLTLLTLQLSPTLLRILIN